MNPDRVTYILALWLFTSCSQDGKAPLDTPTTGEITISVDETFRPVIESEVSTFMSLYHYAKINVKYTSEAEAFSNLLNDSARLIIVTRNLLPDEKKHFDRIKIFPRVIKAGVDAIAFIVNEENTDTNITLSALREIFGGKKRRWEQLNAHSRTGEIKIIFDNKNSGTARYIKEVLCGNSENLPSNTFAVNTNPDVVDYVAKDKNAIGVIGVNWISDGDDPMSLGFLSKVNVMAVASDTSGVVLPEFIQPFQAYIAQKKYPFCRDMLIISREARSGLGTGFAAFVAGDKGQRIILKSGLLPAAMPVRIINLHN